MVATEISSLEREWSTLQNNYEQYEKGGLIIKLTAIVLCTIVLAIPLNQLLTLPILLILWLQESIYKTYQSRLGFRILRIEELLTQKNIEAEKLAFQFHSEWFAKRGGIAILITEYIKNAIKPTVAFPYVALLFINLLYIV